MPLLLFLNPLLCEMFQHPKICTQTPHTQMSSFLRSTRSSSIARDQRPASTSSVGRGQNEFVVHTGTVHDTLPSGRENELNSQRVFSAMKSKGMYGRADLPDVVDMKRAAARAASVGVYEASLARKLKADESHAAIQREQDHALRLRESEMTQILRGDFAAERPRPRPKNAKNRKRAIKRFTAFDAAVPSSRDYGKESQYRQVWERVLGEKGGRENVCGVIAALVCADISLVLLFAVTRPPRNFFCSFSGSTAELCGGNRGKKKCLTSSFRVLPSRRGVPKLCVREAQGHLVKPFWVCRNFSLWGKHNNSNNSASN